MEIAEEEFTEEYQCMHCHQPISEDARFCNHCGVLQAVPDVEDALQKQQLLITLTIFFGVHLAICLFSNFTNYTRGLVPLLIVDGALSTFTLVYVLLFRRDLKKLFRWEKLFHSQSVLLCFHCSGRRHPCKLCSTLAEQNHLWYRILLLLCFQPFKICKTDNHTFGGIATRHLWRTGFSWCDAGRIE